MQGCPWLLAQCHLQANQYNHMISVGADSTSGHLAPFPTITLGSYQATKETKVLKQPTEEVPKPTNQPPEMQQTHFPAVQA